MATGRDAPRNNQRTPAEANGTSGPLVHSTPLVAEPSPLASAWRRAPRIAVIQPPSALATPLTSGDAIALGRRVGDLLGRKLAAPADGETVAISAQATQSELPTDNGLEDVIARLRRVFADEPSQFAFVRFRRRRVAPPPPDPVPTGMPRSDETVNPTTVRELSAEIDPGESLSEEQRTRLEPVIGTILRDVRIHTGPIATATAKALGADAFTVGRDVFFRQGRFEPSTKRGEALLAHELVHVGQQASADREPSGARRDSDVAEAEAEAVEQMVLAGNPTDSGLTVGKFVRNYASSDGKPISHRDRQRLDAISIRALDVCERLLGRELIRTSEQQIARLQVDVSVDLVGMTDEQAADVWGRALADAIRQKRG